jgi:hypothetical protein
MCTVYVCVIIVCVYLHDVHDSAPSTEGVSVHSRQQTLGQTLKQLLRILINNNNNMEQPARQMIANDSVKHERISQSVSQSSNI